MAAHLRVLDAEAAVARAVTEQHARVHRQKVVHGAVADRMHRHLPVNRGASRQRYERQSPWEGSCLGQGRMR